MKFKGRSALLPRAVQIVFSRTIIWSSIDRCTFLDYRDRNLLSSIFLSFHRTGLPCIAPGLALTIAYFGTGRAMLIDIPLFLSEQPNE